MEAIQQAIAVLFVLGLLGGTLYWLRAKGLARFDGKGIRPQGAKQMQSLERLPLTPQHSLHLVSVGGRSPAGRGLARRLLVVDGAAAQLSGESQRGTDDPARLATRLASGSWRRLRRGRRAAGSRTRCLGINMSKDGDSLSVPMQIVILLTLLTLLPAVVMSHHAVSAHHHRAALSAAGAGHADHAVQPGAGGHLAVSDHADRAAGGHGHVPPGLGAAAEQQDHRRPGLRRRLQAAQGLPGPLRARKRRQAFVEISPRARAAQRRPIWSCTVLIPAYILSELKAGFQIGAVLFLPFLIIDLVVASVTLSIGMVQLPPVMISAPFKILLFVLADGWNLVVGSLMKGFYA